MLRAKHLSLKRMLRAKGDAAGEAPQSKKKRVMLWVKHLSLKKKRDDAEGEAPKSVCGRKV